MRYHGRKALWLAGEIETICKQYWAALQGGEPVILTGEQMTNVLARFKSYGKQADEMAKSGAEAVFAPLRRDAPGKKKVRKREGVNS